MNRNLLIFAVILLILVIIAYFALGTGKGVTGKTAVLNGHTFTLEIADTDPERVKGLSSRDSLPKDGGILFLFDKPGKYAFWMKDMRFPIDIIYLSDTKVVTIYDSVPAFFTDGGVQRQNLTNYLPTADSNRVLEINAGQAKQYGLQVGDTIVLKL